MSIYEIAASCICKKTLPNGILIFRSFFGGPVDALCFFPSETVSFYAAVGLTELFLIIRRDNHIIAEISKCNSVAVA